MTLMLRRVAISSALATAGVLLSFDRTDGPSPPGVRTVPVVVAGKDLPGGVFIDRMSLVVAQWPAGAQPAGAYGSVDSVAGRVTRVPVYKGEAIAPGRLAPARTAGDLEVLITPGKRAYGIRINDFASLAGMVQPNNRVDIMIVSERPKPRQPAHG